MNNVQCNMRVVYVVSGYDDALLAGYLLI